MNHVDKPRTLMRELDQVEDGPRVPRDRVEVKTKVSINEALRDCPWRVDKALEQEASG